MGVSAMKNLFSLIIVQLLLFGTLFPQEQAQQSAFPEGPLVISANQKKLGQLSLEKNAPLFTSEASNIISSSIERMVFSGVSEESRWSLEVSFSRSSAEWSEWKEIEIHRFPYGRFWVKAMIDNQFKNGIVRFRIINRGMAAPCDIVFHSIEFIASPAETKEVFQPQNDRKQTANDTILPPSIITRAQWGASPSNGVLIPHIPTRGAIHHTAEVRVATLEQGIAEMKFIQDLHMKGNGWKDIGYHFCIDDSGRIYEGAEKQYIASHTDNNNSRNTGIAFFGSFSSVTPTTKALNACAALVAYLETIYPIQTDSIFGHRDYVPSTECPGAALYPLLPSIRNSIRQIMAQSKPYVKDPAPLPFSTTALPSTSISCNLRDDQEGIRSDSVKVFMNNKAVVPIIQSIDAKELKISFTPSVPFDYASLVQIDIIAQDAAIIPNRLHYQYQFRIKAQAIYNEMADENSITNGTIVKAGVWTVNSADVVLPDLTDGVMISAIDSTGTHRAEIFPNVKESGNYYISLAMPVQMVGINARYTITNSNGFSKDEFLEYNRNYSSTWYQLGTGAVYFSAGTPSNGSIQLQPFSGFTVAMMIDAIKLEKTDPLAPPAIPELQSVRNTTDGKIAIEWYASQEGGLAGYRLMKSTDGVSWLDTIATEQTLKPQDTIFTYLPPSGIGILYFKIVSVDTQQTENADGRLEHVISASSDVYGVAYGFKKRILIVDAFDRVGSWLEGQHSFVRNFGNALGTMYGGWESAVNDIIQSGKIRLEDYEIVLYMCGDDSDRDESVSNIEQLRLKKYLEGGGKLFISGSEIAYDLGRSGRPDIALFNQIFKAAYSGDDSGVRSCTGAVGGPLDGISFTFGAVTEDTYLEDFPDYITPLGGSQVILYYQNTSKVAGITFSGFFASSATAQGKIVYFAFPFETIYPAQSRTDVMHRLMDNILGTTFVEPVASASPARFDLQQNYPNPFNPVTILNFELPVCAHAKLSIFDLLGREVAVLVNEKKVAGRYSVKWNATRLSSGIYFYRLSAGQYQETKRMSLLK